MIRQIRSLLSYHGGRSQYLFIHIPKNGGVSISRAKFLRGRVLRAHRHFHKSRQYSNEVLAVMKANGEHHGFEHARLRDISTKVRSSHIAFAIVRNPWSRVVSRYTYARQAMESGESPPEYAADTFEGFLEERHMWGDKEFYWHRAIRGWYPQLDYVTDEDGVIVADILRNEHMTDEVSRYFGIEQRINRHNVSGGKRDYREYYNARTIQIVADWYAADIDQFGFDLDTPATRNTYFANPDPVRSNHAETFYKR